MSKDTLLGRRALAVAAILVVVGVFGLAHATLGLYQTAGAQYVGHWVWNDEDAGTSEVDVRIKAAPPKRPKTETAIPVPIPVRPCVRNFKVEVTGLADDGTSPTNSALVQVPAGFIREVHVPFDRTLTSLTFIKILSLGTSGACNALP